MKRFTLSSLDGLDLSGLGAPALARPRFNIARNQDALVAVQRGGARTITGMRWGMLSPWRGHGGKRPPMVYEAGARDLTASMPAGLDARSSTPPTFLRNAVRTQRCLVIADGWFAWRRTRSPYWIHPPAPGPITLAGIWTVHSDDDRPSFAILVTPAGPTLSPLAAATPVPIGDAWLGPVGPALDALAAVDGACDRWRADAVSPWVNDEAHDDPRCIAPLGNPAQGELF